MIRLFLTLLMVTLAALTPEQRSYRARIAAHTRWSREDPVPNAIRAQAGLTARFEREILSEFPGSSFLSVVAAARTRSSAWAR